MTDPEPKAPDGDAVELFADFLARCEAGEKLEFDDFCQANPEQEEALREMHGHWSRVHLVVGKLTASHRSLASRRASAALASDMIDGAGEDAEFFQQLFERLMSRGDASSRFRVEGEVAKGGMGTILRVWDHDLRRRLAMKVVMTSDHPVRGKTMESRVLARFVEEAQVTGQLDHPGIVPVHELGLDEEGRAFFTMRLVVGRDLEKIFEEVHAGSDERWNQTRAVSILLKVCEAMAYAHAKGVIHRDLKPANIMVGRFGEVYVMDWGLARVLGREDSKDLRPVISRVDPPTAVHTDRREIDRHSAKASPLVTMDGDVIGTPAYMPPEQARGELDAMGPGSDVYSVGAILYHLLTANPPYKVPGKKVNAVKVWGLVQSEPPMPVHELAPQAPAELVAICEKAMARPVDQRYLDMQDLADDLRAYLEGRVVHAYETGAIAEFRKWVRRNKALAATGIVAVLLIVAGTSTASFVLAKKNKQLAKATLVASQNEQAALASEEVAQRNARLAEERSEQVLRLSDVTRLEQLEREAEDLWPATPRNVTPYREWLTTARELSKRLPTHRATLEAIRLRALPWSDAARERDRESHPRFAELEGLQFLTGAAAVAKREALEQEVGARRTWVFPSTEEQWQHDTLRDLVAGIEAFDSPGGTLADVERRLEFASTIEFESLTSPAAEAAWKEAVASIMNVDECPAYGGLVIWRQLGLLPLGRDPSSGLWEFAHLQTGEPPVREDGVLQMTEKSGAVFVLIPGGTFLMGAQETKPGAPGYDPLAGPKETPPHEITLEPFFLSKYELDQAQWEHFTGETPSLYGPNTEISGNQHTLLHPVEQVTWDECRRFVERLGLRLPTEAQWEYAARAGTTSSWSTGSARETLEGYANLADRAGLRGGANWPAIDDWPELDDGWGVHAPVDALMPNPWGLHGMHGNVWEWVRDLYGTYGYVVAEGDGERSIPESAFHVNRGGSFAHSATQARPAYRNLSPASSRSGTLGFRPSRELEK